MQRVKLVSKHPPTAGLCPGRCEEQEMYRCVGHPIVSCYLAFAQYKWVMAQRRMELVLSQGFAVVDPGFAVRAQTWDIIIKI